MTVVDTATLDPPLEKSAPVNLRIETAITDHAVTYHHVPLLTDIKGAMTSDDLMSGAYRDRYVPMYVAMFERSAGLIVHALAVMATAPGAVAFHCAAGKDRTGVLAASLLLALGADDEAIVADYGRTGPNVPAIMSRARAVTGPMMRAMGIRIDPAALAAGERDFHEDALRATLAVLRERHDGDALAPVRAAGLNDALIDMLRARALG